MGRMRPAIAPSKLAARAGGASRLCSQARSAVYFLLLLSAPAVCQRPGVQECRCRDDQCMTIPRAVVNLFTAFGPAGVPRDFR